MQSRRLLQLTAVAAVTLASFVGSNIASATELDCGKSSCLYETSLLANNELTVILHPPIGDIECTESRVNARLTNTGSSSSTAGGNISTLEFGWCNATVTVLKKGSWEIHTRTSSSDNNGTLTSTGAEVTIEFAGFHCVFATNGTDLGTLTGEATTKIQPTLDIEASIPRTGGRSGAFCGSTAQWTGSYYIWSPIGVNVT